MRRAKASLVRVCATLVMVWRPEDHDGMGVEALGKNIPRPPHRLDFSRAIDSA